jgi:hypothetical protein
LIESETAVFLAPAVIRLLCDPELANHLCRTERSTLREPTWKPYPRLPTRTGLRSHRSSETPWRRC